MTRTRDNALVLSCLGPCRSCGRSPNVLWEGPFVVRRCHCGDVERLSTSVIEAIRFSENPAKDHAPARALRPITRKISYV